MHLTQYQPQTIGTKSSIEHNSSRLRHNLFKLEQKSAELEHTSLQLEQITLKLEQKLHAALYKQKKAASVETAFFICYILKFDWLN